MSSKSTVSKVSSGVRAGHAPASRGRPADPAGGTGSSRRRDLRTARRRDVRGRRIGQDEFRLRDGYDHDHEIDPAFDELGDLELQVEALFMHRWHEAMWDRFSESDGSDFR